MKYKLITAKQMKTVNGNNYWNMIAWDVQKETYVECTYFGNTRPKAVMNIKYSSKNGINYANAIIQPHTSRDKRTGKFKCGWRVE